MTEELGNLEKSKNVLGHIPTLHGKLPCNRKKLYFCNLYSIILYQL